MVTSSLQFCTKCSLMKGCGDVRPAVCFECEMLGDDDHTQSIAHQFGAPLMEVDEAGFERFVDTIIEDSGDAHEEPPDGEEGGSSCGPYLHEPPEEHLSELIAESLVSSDGRLSPQLNLGPQSNRDPGSGMPFVP